MTSCCGRARRISSSTNGSSSSPRRPRVNLMAFSKRDLLTALVAMALPALLHAAPVTNLAGTGKAGFSGDGRPATQASLRFPCGLVVGPDDAGYVCDMLNHVVRRI